MDRRKVIFAVMVVALAAIGVYLTMLPPSGSGDLSSAPEPAITDTPTEGPAEPDPVPTDEPTGAFDVYPLLPIEKAELEKAASTARRFAAAYASYRHDEEPEAYRNRLAPMTTAELADALARGVSSPAELEKIKNAQEVSQGAARLESIRDMAEDSAIFVVVTTQHITSKDGKEERTAKYAITITKVGEAWKIHDIEPADVGEEGDEP